jgi:ankyrin repeat protein
VNSTLISIVAVILLAGATFAGPIHDAALNGDLAGVQAELDKGVDVNAKSDDGTTPLDVAIELKRTGIVNLFRKHGGKTGEELKTESK